MGNLNVLSNLSISVPTELARRLGRIELEDYGPVCKKVREHFEEIGAELPAGHLDRGIYALKQYYAVALLDPANAHAISRPLDPFWHAHILHTEEYMCFCNDVVGEYMHHQPLDRGDAVKVAKVRSLYDYTRKRLEQIFTFVDQSFWPAALTDADLICVHKGNQDIYREVQAYRLFEPDARLAA